MLNSLGLISDQKAWTIFLSSINTIGILGVFEVPDLH